ncbi:MAG TPA: MFS transporter [Casimicrobiaceae bacterium]|nr:MFS transporter [Casimicrobiaceae bacterium]
MRQASLSANSPASRTFFGRWVVRAAFVLAIFGWGVGLYGPPVFLHAVIVRTGWPLVTVSSAVTLHFLFGALVVVNLPRAHRRFGVPATIVAGACITALGIVGWASASVPWQLFASAIASGAGWVAMGAVAVNAVIAPWYERTRPIALAKAYNGASIGGVIFSPLWVASIASAGFLAAGVAVGMTTIFVVAMLARFVFGKTPAELGQRCDGDDAGGGPVLLISAGAPPLPGRTLWQDRKFLTLSAGMATGLFVQIGLVAHLFNLLAPVAGAQAAGLAMGIATAAAILGRVLVARALGPGKDRRLAACAAYAVQLVGVLVLASASEQHLGWILVGVLLFGCGIGNATSLPPLIAQVEFTKADLPRVIALVVGIAQATYAFAPAAFGALLTIVDGDAPRFGHGTSAFFVVAAILQSVAIGCFGIGRRPRAPR